MADMHWRSLGLAFVCGADGDIGSSRFDAALSHTGIIAHGLLL
jgi:hypothetical protein